MSSAVPGNPSGPADNAPGIATPFSNHCSMYSEFSVPISTVAVSVIVSPSQASVAAVALVTTGHGTGQVDSGNTSCTAHASQPGIETS